MRIEIVIRDMLRPLWVIPCDVHETELVYAKLRQFIVDQGWSV